MQAASQALADMDYLRCERLCLDALTAARDNRDWDAYARVLLPLQEARRQRRITAAEGAVRLGTTTLDSDPATWLDNLDPACLVITHPHTPDTARTLLQSARRQHRMIEILYADNLSDADPWRITSFDGPPCTSAIAAPPPPSRERWSHPTDTLDPAAWFLHAAESLGDQAAQHATAPPGDPQRITQLEHALLAVTDHEILHQQLAHAAKAAAHHADKS